MKNSGIERIGEIPSDWKICRFRNIVNIYNGNSIKDEEKANYEDAVDAIPYIATKDIDATFQTINYNNGMYIKAEDKSFKKAPYNSVLLCIEGGSAGKKIAFTNQEVCFINKLCCFHSNIVNNKFLFYYMQSPSFTEEFKNHISGLIGGVSISEIKGFSFVFAPIEEQEKIVAYLDEKCAEIDTVIEKTKATIEEYKKLKQSVITQAVTKGIRPNRPMKDSGIEWIGEVPADWQIVKTKYVADVNHGTDPKTEGDIPVYGSGAESFKTCGEYKEGPTVLVGRKGATLHIPHYIEGKYWNVDTAFDVKTYPNYLLRYFFYAACCFDYKYFMSQTTLPGMTQSNYNNMIMPFPLRLEQDEIVYYLDKKCSEIDELIAKKTSLLSELESYKKSLIYEYVTGKKEVQNRLTINQ